MDWIIAKIRSFRQNLGYSQQYMAEKVGVDIRTYGNWERGTNEITISNLKKIADVLNIELAEIWDQTKWVSKPFTQEDKHLILEETVAPYYSKSNTDQTERLIREVEILKEQNLALTRAYNELFEKKSHGKAVLH